MSTPTASPDSQAIALVCSRIALGNDRALKPLSAGEWHELSLALRLSPLTRPRELIGLRAGELREALGADAALADRLAALLSRGGQLSFELERLASLGIWLLTRADDGYPILLKQRLRGQTPPVLFGAGPQAAFAQPSIAVVGSRDVDADGLSWASSFGGHCSAQGFGVVSGAARGVDTAAMSGALTMGGFAIGVTVDPLDRLIRRREFRQFIFDDALTLVTPFEPSARWYASNAMRRNRLIYALSQAAVVVASSAERGGTRAGAVENVRAGWVPLYVRDDGSDGNRRLIHEGAGTLPAGSVDHVPVARLPERSSTLLKAGLTLTLPVPRAEAPHVDEAEYGTAVDDPDDAKPLVEEAFSPRDPDAPARLDDLFEVVWPTLSAHLTTPLTEREVADRAHLELTQARAWLKRAVAEGRAAVTKRPKRYVAHTLAGTQLRIDGH